MVTCKVGLFPGSWESNTSTGRRRVRVLGNANWRLPMTDKVGTPHGKQFAYVEQIQQALGKNKKGGNPSRYMMKDE